MKIDIEILPEPVLEFGGSVRGYSPKLSLPTSGPYLLNQGTGAQIELGLVGPQSEIPHVRDWFEKMNHLLVSNENNALRYPLFPGVAKVIRTSFVIHDRSVIKLGKELPLALAIPNKSERFDALIDLYADAVKSLSSDLAPKCIIICLPEEVATLSIENRSLTYEEKRKLERLSTAEVDPQLNLFDLGSSKEDAAELLPQADELLVRYFHRALKARCMSLPNPVPTQVIREQTYKASAEKQSEATRAWNLTVALLYKAGNVPWRPVDLDEGTCFAGISFHHLKTRGGSLMYSSVAHAFSNAVEPFILKGASIPHHQTWRKQPYLNEEQAGEIMRQLITGYERRTGSAPARIVIHKTSQFAQQESDGFTSAAKEKVANVSLVWIRPTGFRLLKHGTQEPLRGTYVTIGDERSFLFTTGYVPWWEEYPGPHIPAPLEIGGDRDSLRDRAREILSLSKMNWNTADGIGRSPITLSFARRVGMIMAELNEDIPPNPSYRFYM